MEKVAPETKTEAEIEENAQNVEILKATDDENSKEDFVSCISKSNDFWVFSLMPYLDSETLKNFCAVSKYFRSMYLLYYRPESVKYRREAVSKFSPYFIHGMEYFELQHIDVAGPILKFSPSLYSLLDQKYREKYFFQVMSYEEHNFTYLNCLFSRTIERKNFKEYLLFLIDFFAYSKFNDQTVICKYLEVLLRTQIFSSGELSNILDKFRFHLLYFLNVAVKNDLPHLIIVILKKEELYSFDQDGIGFFSLSYEICMKYQRFDTLLYIFGNIKNIDSPSFKRILIERIIPRILYEPGDFSKVLDTFLNRHSSLLTEKTDFLSFFNYAILTRNKSSQSVAILAKYFDVNVFINDLSEGSPVGKAISNDLVQTLKILLSRTKIENESKYFDLLHDIFIRALYNEALNILRYFLDELWDKDVLRAHLEDDDEHEIITYILEFGAINVLDVLFNHEKKDVFLNLISSTDWIIYSLINSHGQVDTFNFFMNYFGVDTESFLQTKYLDGLSPFLMVASLGIGSIQVLYFLFEMNPNSIHDTDSQGNNAFYLAVHAKKPVEFLKHLVELNVDHSRKNNANESGKDLLHSTVIHGHYGITVFDELFERIENNK